MDPWIVARTAAAELSLWRAGEERCCEAVPGAVVGDRVAFGDDGRPRLLPRSGALSRAAADGTSREQVLAANIDVVLIVEPLPRPNQGRIDRLAVLGWSSGGAPVVVLTKADLVAVPEARAAAASVAAASPGMPVLVCSTATGEGVDQVRTLLPPGQIGVLLGPSGAGKSTLVNRLAGRDAMATGETRARDGKGRHTTSHRELLELPGGGLLIDTPGLRAVGLAGDPDAVDLAYPDIAELAQGCRFADCAHDGEPGCAVAEAVASGALAQRRVDGWRTLQREAVFQQTRGDARARREAERTTTRTYRAIGREARRRKGG